MAAIAYGPKLAQGLISKIIFYWNIAVLIIYGYFRPAVTKLSGCGGACRGPPHAWGSRASGPTLGSARGRLLAWGPGSWLGCPFAGPACSLSQLCSCLPVSWGLSSTPALRSALDCRARRGSRSLVLRAQRRLRPRAGRAVRRRHRGLPPRHGLAANGLPV